MITIKTSKKINLNQLDKELGGFGLCLNEENPENVIVGIADGSSVTKEELAEAIENHIAIDTQAEAAAAKAALLAKLGITEEEAKLLLS